MQLVLGMLTGWLDRRERKAIAYLIEQNRLLRRQLGGRPLAVTDEDRRGGPSVPSRPGGPAGVRGSGQFVIDLASRRLQILGSTPHPDAVFMQQTVRTLMMAEDGPVHAPHLLICDRDRKWSGDVRRKNAWTG